MYQHSYLYHSLKVSWIYFSQQTSILGSIMTIPICAAFGGFNAHKNSFLSSAITASAAISVGYYVGLESMEVLMIGLIASSIGFFRGTCDYEQDLDLSQIQFSYFINFIRAGQINLYIRILINTQKDRSRFIPKKKRCCFGKSKFMEKFSMSMLALFFIYSILMEKGEYYGNLTVMLVLGYVLTTLLMVRSIIFKTHIKQSVLCIVVQHNNHMVYNFMLWAIKRQPYHGYNWCSCFTILASIHKCSNLPIFIDSWLFCQLHFIYW